MNRDALIECASWAICDAARGEIAEDFAHLAEAAVDALLPLVTTRAQLEALPDRDDGKRDL